MSRLVDWDNLSSDQGSGSSGLIDWDNEVGGGSYQTSAPMMQAQPRMQSQPEYQFAQAPAPMTPPMVQYSSPAGPPAPPPQLSMRDKALGILGREMPRMARSFDLNAQIMDNTPAIKEARTAQPGEYLQQLGEGAGYGVNQLIDAAQYFMQLPARVPAAALTLNPDMLFPQGTEPDALDQILGRRNNAHKWKEAHPANLPATYDIGKYLSQMLLPGGLGAKATTYGSSVGLGALEGAGQGFITGVADQLSEGKFDPAGLALNTGLGGAFGGAAGGIGQFLGRIFPKKGAPGASAPVDPNNPTPPPVGGMSPYFAKQLEAEAAQMPTTPQVPPAMPQPAPQMLSGRVESSQIIPEPDTGDILARLGLAPKPQAQPPAKPRVRIYPTARQPVDDALPISAQQTSLETGYKPKETAPPELPGGMETNKSAPRDILADLGLKPKEPQMVAEPDIEGAFRLRRDSFGRNKVDKAKEAALYSQEVQDAVSEVAKKKVSLDYRNSVLASYSKRLWEKLKASGHVTDADKSFQGPNGVILNRAPDDKLPSYINGKLEQLRHDLASGVEQNKGKQHVAAVAGAQFGREGPHGLKSFDVPIPDDLNQAFRTLEKLHLSTSSEAKLANSAQKAYDEAKGEFKPLFQEAQGNLRSKNPQESFTARTKVKAPFGEDVDVAVSLDRQAMHLKLSEDAEKVYKAAVDAEMQKLAANRNRVPKFRFSVDARKSLMKKAMAVFGIGLLANSGSAEAATPGGSKKEDKNPFSDMGALARLAIGAAMVHTLAPKLAKHLLTKNFMHSNVIFNDTVQRITMLDEVLGTDVAKQLWMHQGAIFNSSFGVKVDAEIRAEAMRALRQGEVSIQDALQGTVGTPFENMDKEARIAIVEAEKIKQSLKGIIKSQMEDLDDFLKDNPEKANELAHMKDALHDVMEAFSPQRVDTFERGYKGLLSKFMDYHFFYNPAFHLTNLSDQIISGGTRVGPMNLLKANIALAKKEGELTKLMKHSNLTGGFEAERINTALEAGKKGFKVKDFKSDKFNADRVALGSIFQYASGKGKLMGWTGSEEEFAEQLLKGKLDPEIAVDAYAHMAETLSRTLGVDPLRVNSDVFSSSHAGKYLSVFIKQPARVSNLLMHHLADGNLKYFYMMLGATALAGGKAAIPTDVGYAWEKVDPASYFAAAAMLDKAELLQYATGKTMSPKLQWAILAPFVSSSDPLRSNVGRTMQDGMDALSKIKDGEFDRKKGYALLGNALSIFAPRIAGLPSKQIINGLSAADSALFEDTIPVTYYDQFGKSYGQKDEFSRQEMGLSGAKQFIDNFLPGESSSVNYAKMAKREETRRSKNLGFGMFGDPTQSRPFFNPDEKNRGALANFLFGGAK